MVMARPKVKTKEKPKVEKIVKPKHPKISKKSTDASGKRKKTSDSRKKLESNGKDDRERKVKSKAKHSEGKGKKEANNGSLKEREALLEKARKFTKQKLSLVAKLIEEQKRKQKMIAKLRAKRHAARAVKHKYVKFGKRIAIIKEIRPCLHSFINLVKTYRMLDAASTQSLQEVKQYMKMAAVMKLTGEERNQILAVMDEQVKQTKSLQHMLSNIIFEMAEAAIPFCKANGKVRQAMAEAQAKAEPEDSGEAALKKLEERAKAIVIAKGRAYAARLLSKGSRSRRRRAVKSATAVATAAVSNMENQKARSSARFDESAMEEKTVAATTPKKGRGGRTSTAARTPASARSAKGRRRDSGGDTFSPMSPNQSEASATPSTSGRGGRGGRRGGGAKRAAASAVRKPRRSSGRRGGRKRSSSDETVEYIPGAGPDEPTYCLCKRISFGDMIGCDNEKCVIEWFHFECVNLKTKPKGKKWYCPDCRGDRPTVPKKNL